MIDSITKHITHANKRHSGDSKTVFGFWVYLMTDCILFATLFATYAVLKNSTHGGPSSNDIFELPFVLTETLILLTSSFVCGLALLAARQRKLNSTILLLSITALLGAAFVSMELYEFNKLISEGHGWQHSAFLSAFFVLVATHGLHISVGLLWLFVLMGRLKLKGFTPGTLRKLTLFGLFWHFLDIVWIFIFSIVYLLGVL